MSDKFDADYTAGLVAVRLLDLADLAEKVGQQQFHRSARQAYPGTEFGNALYWGNLARAYRRAADDIRNMTSSTYIPRWAAGAIDERLQHLLVDDA